MGKIAVPSRSGAPSESPLPDPQAPDTLGSVARVERDRRRRGTGIVRKLLLWGGLAIAAMAILAGCHANATVFTVNTTADTVDVSPGNGVCLDGSGTCSLRAALMEANASPGVNRINLAAGQTYTLTRAGANEDAAATGDLDITDGVDIVGAAGTVINANGLDRVFDVRLTGTASVDIQRLAITGGAAPDGAALRGGTTGTVGFLETEVRDNDASAGAPISMAGGTAIWVGATVADNTGTSSGGLRITSGSATLLLTTFSGNTASTGAGAVSVAGGSVIAQLSTITANSGVTAGGVLRSSGSIAVQGTIIADQTAGVDCSGAVGDGGYNLESSTTCAFTGVGGLQNTDPMLGALGNNGGLIRTHLPSGASPAVDQFTAGPGGCEAGHDARTFTRPQGPACDTGAVELTTFVVDDGGDTVDTNAGDGACADASSDCTLRAAVLEANALAGEQRIVFDPSVTEATLSRVGTGEDASATGDLDLTGAVTIDGGADGVIVNGGGVDRVFQTRPGSAATLRRLRITNGIVATASGGGIFINGTSTSISNLTVDSVTIDGNDSNNGDGIQVGSFGALQLHNSTVSSNAGNGVRSSGTMNVSYSTITGNTTVGLVHSAGVTTVSTSIVAGNNTECSGFPSSGGYNITDNTSCSLFTNTGDQMDVPARLGTLLVPDGSQLPSNLPGASSPAVDAIPLGVMGCGTATQSDGRSTDRPLGGACDKGAVERNGADGAVTFTVTHDGEAVDSDLGDGVCQDQGGDPGDCSLRSAVQEANNHYGADTIDFDPSVDVVTFTRAGSSEDLSATGDLDLLDSVTIDGGAAGVTIDAADLDRVVHTPTYSDFTLRRLRLTNGTPPSSGQGIHGGGGLKAEAALLGANPKAGSSVTVDSVTIDNNVAVDGAGIYVNEHATVAVVNSTLSSNTTEGIRSYGMTTIQNSTFAGNPGAGVYEVLNSLTLTGSVLSGNGFQCGGTPQSGGYNLVSDATCNALGTGDVQNVDAELGGLVAADGSQLRSYLPDATSAAVDAIPAGSAGCGTTVGVDQHGVARPANGACEKGAAEFLSSYATDFTVNHGADAVDSDPGDGVCQDQGGDPGDCSLRAAVLEANAHYGDDTIDFDPSVTIVNLSIAGTSENAALTGDLDLTDSVTIDGGTAGVVVDANDLDRVFHAHPYSETNLRRLRLTDGFETVTFGGGFSVDGVSALGAHATVDSVTVDNNTSVQGDGLYVHANASLEVTNSTIAENVGQGIKTFGALTISYSTIAGNGGNGLVHSGGSTVLTATILGDNASNCVGSPTSDGYNISDDTTCTGLTDSGDQQNVDPQISWLLPRSGSQLLGILTDDTSPARDAIAAGVAGCGTTVTEDQYGVGRPSGGACDKGAVEADGTVSENFTVTHGGDVVDSDPGDGVCQDQGGDPGDCSLRAAVQEANNHFGSDTIDFDPSVTTVNLSIAGLHEDSSATGDLDLSGSVAIDGGPDGVTVDANDIDRVFHAQWDADVELRRLRLTDGSIDSDTGGGLDVDGIGAAGGLGSDVTVDSVTIDNNHAFQGDGIHVHFNATLTVVNSTIAGNNGQGIKNFGVADISYTTIANNVGNGVVHSSGTTTVTASILAYNAAECVGAVGSGGYNLAHDANCTGFTGPGDQQSVDPLLGALADNGGPTLTYLPAAGSPALNVVPNSTAGCGTTVAVDQRGDARPKSSSCDAGAVER
jgi:CSLREA domain-containing protein